jgi:hypothetical protein
MKKRLLKLGLLALNALVPVFIAACYGVEWFCVGGRVRDKNTGQGINGIRVTCLVTNGPMEFVLAETRTGSASGDYYYECVPGLESSSDADADGDADADAGGDAGPEDLGVDGVFQISDESLRSCPMLRFTDVDGPANGSYRERTVWDRDFDGVVDLEPVSD